MTTHPADQPRPQRPSAVNLLLRVAVSLVGIFIMSIAVTLSVRSRIGTSPISAIPVVLDEATPLSLGNYVLLLNMVLLGIQFAILRRRFQLIRLLQLPTAAAFGMLSDLSMSMLDWVNPQNYAMQLGCTILSVCVLAVGVWLMVSPRVLVLPGDAVSVVIADEIKRPFGYVKIAVDGTLVAIAVVLSLLLLGYILGVREGTVISVVMVGFLVRQLQRIPLPAWLTGTPLQ